MPYCPNCREEVEEGLSACTVCGSDLLDGPPGSDAPEGLADFEAVFVGPLSRALEVKSLLEEEGFTVYLQSEEDCAAVDRGPGSPPPPVKLFVPPDAAIAALEIVDSMAGEAVRTARPGADEDEDDEDRDAGEEGEPGPSAEARPEAGPARRRRDGPTRGLAASSRREAPARPAKARPSAGKGADSRGGAARAGRKSGANARPGRKRA